MTALVFKDMGCRNLLLYVNDTYSFRKNKIPLKLMKKKLLLFIITFAIGMYSCAAAKPIKVLMLGGDKHHDYKLCYDVLDRKILENAGIAKVTYTEDIAECAKELPDTDVFMACGNVKYDDALKQAIMDFLDRDGGFMLMHAAVWTRKGWPLLNTKIVGGTPKGHEKKGNTFDVHNLMPDHALMKGVPASFGIVDELYRIEHHQKNIKWTILAESKSRETGLSYPSIWISKRKTGKVLSCALGHDQLAHDVPAYKQFLRNAITWLGHRE